MEVFKGGLSFINLNNQFINYVLWYLKFQEPEQRQQKCAQYWPDEETEGNQNGGIEFGTLSIHSRGEDLIDADDLGYPNLRISDVIKRDLELKENKTSNLRNASSGNFCHMRFYVTFRTRLLL